MPVVVCGHICPIQIETIISSNTSPFFIIIEHNAAETNGRHFTETILKLISVDENCHILIQILARFVLKGLIKIFHRYFNPLDIWRKNNNVIITSKQCPSVGFTSQ